MVIGLLNKTAIRFDVKVISSLMIILMLFLITVGALVANMVEADPFPPPVTEITIESPKNTTYHNNTITLVFLARSVSFFPNTNLYYSIDNGKQVPVGNYTVVSDEYLPINPGIYVKNISGNVELGSLSEGLHNVTVYDIRHLNNDPQDEEIVYSTTAQFVIVLPQAKPSQPPQSDQPLLTAFLIVSSISLIVVALASIFYYYRKHKPVSQETLTTKT